MALTLHDLKEKLSRALSETELLEVLEINNEQIVERFEDLIIEKFDYLSDELEEEQGE